MNEQKPLIDWLGNPIEVPSQVKPDPTINPMIEVYGVGPDNQICENCTYIAGIVRAKTYYKCLLRNNTHSAKTNHKLKWQACSKFEPRELMCEGRVKDIPIYDGRN